jgi:trehalose synthase
VARVSLQRSLREGFGLVASEALWKRTPVVAGPGGGVPAQVRDGRDGYITDDVAQMARRVAELVEDPGLAVALGTSGRQHVQDHFLVTRLLEDELRLMQSVLGGRPATVGS